MQSKSKGFCFRTWLGAFRLLFILFVIGKGSEVRTPFSLARKGERVGDNILSNLVNNKFNIKLDRSLYNLLDELPLPLV